MNYYAIWFEGETRVEGPVLDWRALCLKMFGIIDIKMRVKCLGNDPNKKKLADLVGNIEGWFHPFIPDSELGVTMRMDGAFGPYEISRKLCDIGERLKVSKGIDEIDSCAEDSVIWLRRVPLVICEAFNNMIKFHRDRISNAARIG